MSDTTLEARCLPILRRIGVLSEVELARLVRAERVDVCRVLSTHKNVATVKDSKPKVFEWRES